MDGNRLTMSRFNHLPGLRCPTAEQSRVIALAAGLATEFDARVAANDAASRFPPENYAALHQSGYLRLALPAAYGGEGLNVFDMVLAQEVLARGDASTALVCGMNIALTGRVIDGRAWPEPTTADICTTLAREGGIMNSCVTEAELGSISRGGLPSMQAERTAGGWLLTGRKIFITGAPVLRFLLTAVVLPPHDRAPEGELVNAIVERGTPGLRVENTWTGSLGLRGCGNDDVVYDRVFVADERIVERVPVGQPRRAQGGGSAGGTWNLVLSAVALGIGQAACDAAAHYANNRVPAALGQPIASQPHVQQWIGQMDVVLRAARAVLHDTARAAAAGTLAENEAGPAVAAVKYLCTNAACSVTDTALRVAGGFSMTKSLPLERYFRDARGGLFQPPQDDLALSLLGRTALTAERLRNDAAERPRDDTAERTRNEEGRTQT
jgi:alkylation response protein AidB-like acyl-CoA dehydrogenase